MYKKVFANVLFSAGETKKNGIPRGIPSHPGIRALHEDSSPCRLQASLTRSAARM
jgi:hypothetical protein